MQKDFNMYSKQFLIGQRADTSLCQIDSYAAESNIQFGTAVKRGTTKDKQCLPLGDSRKFLGIALRDDLQRVGFLKEESMISVMTKGRVVVRTTAAVIAGDTAYVHADGSINNISKEAEEAVEERAVRAVRVGKAEKSEEEETEVDEIEEDDETEEDDEETALEIGVFASTQESAHELVILEIK
jgi:hypothetical protein